MIAASQGHIEAVKILIRNGSNLNLVDKCGKKASDIAKKSGIHQICNEFQR